MKKKEKLANVRVLSVGRRYGWLVTWPGGGAKYFDGTSHREKKPHAIEFAKKVAMGLGGASVRIHGHDGKIKEERTYPRSRDPKRSRG